MLDPKSGRRLYDNSRREAWGVLIVWGLALIWTVGYCYLNGYQHAADSWVVEWGLAVPRTLDDFQHFAGFPDWIWIGILIPWILCTLLTLGFALWGMADDDLGAEAPEGGTDRNVRPTEDQGGGGDGD